MQLETEPETEGTVTADVGHGPLPDGKEVPESIGEFEVWDCPNNDTVLWTRKHYPATEIEFPRVKEKAGITVAGDGWEVTRTVVLEKSGTGHNVRTGEEYDRVVQNVQYHGCVGTGFDSFEAALSFVEHHVQGLSRMGLPKEVERCANPIHEAFTEIKMEESGSDDDADTGGDQ